jgi:hypothetical protein
VNSVDTLMEANQKAIPSQAHQTMGRCDGHPGREYLQAKGSAMGPARDYDMTSTVRKLTAGFRAGQDVANPGEDIARVIQNCMEKRNNSCSLLISYGVRLGRKSEYKSRVNCWNPLRAMNATTQTKNYTLTKNDGIMLNVMARKVHRLGNQQGSLGRNNVEIRTCRKCHEEKTIDQFPVGCIIKGIEYRRHSCKNCEAARKKDYYNTNIEGIRADQNRKAKLRYNSDLKKYRCQSAEWARHYREEYRNKVLDHYGRKCACCGETTEKFLTVDHVHNDGYIARKNKLHGRFVGSGSDIYRWIVKHGFPKHFQILCMNCNFGKFMGKGICPHQEPSTAISQESTPKQVEKPGSLYRDEDIASPSVQN